jgi:hypothetical protein
VVLSKEGKREKVVGEGEGVVFIAGRSDPEALILGLAGTSVGVRRASVAEAGRMWPKR